MRKVIKKLGTAVLVTALVVKNDDLSSLKVPFGYKVTLYADDNFSGATMGLQGTGKSAVEICTCKLISIV